MKDETKKGRRSIWRLRGRRFASGLNVAVSLALAAAIVLMLNYLSSRHYWRWNLSRTASVTLSGKTLGLLGSLQGDYSVVAFFQRSHPLYEEVRAFLQEYQYAASRLGRVTLHVQFVDPDRDLAYVRDLAQRYDVRESNVLVFEHESRRKYIDTKDLADYDASLKGNRVERKLRALRVEQAFSSALQSLSQEATPVVYVLGGHGERNSEDYNDSSGYSSISRIMRRDNIEVRPLILAEQKGVPKDCSALIVAGPDRSLAATEVDLLATYLSGSGRVMFLMDPRTITGLEGLLEQWGVRLTADVVLGMTLTGRELVITQYGDHPVTRGLRNVTSMFFQPRSVEPIAAQDGQAALRADKPRVTVLAATGREGWAETNLKETPSRFDEGTDRRGPIAVAVAVEKGPVSGPAVEIKPTRLVVFGDSYFVSNGALRGVAGGNADFFMNALNWLLEREALMAIAPRPPPERQLNMTPRQIQLLFLLSVVAVPGAVAAIGMLIWVRRKQ